MPLKTGPLMTLALPHVDDTGPHRIADLEGRDRFRAADEVQVQDALSFFVT